MAGFRNICCDICLDSAEFVNCSDKSSKFNSIACTPVVLDFNVFSGTNFSLKNEGNIFRKFLLSRF